MFDRRYVFGNTEIRYAEVLVEGHEGKTTVGLAAYPKGWYSDCSAEELHLDSLIQAAFTGDETLVDYTPGLTMRNRASCLLHAEDQTADGGGVVTRLTDGRGNCYTHILRYHAASDVFSSEVRYENRTGKPRTLEYLGCLSLSGIANACGNTRKMTLHRMTSAWSRECRLKSDAFSALGLDMSWARYGVKTEKFGQIGSMPNRNYYPFAAIEADDGTVWAVQLEAPFSWQMEVYQEKETCSLTAGGADYEFGHWRKNIAPGGEFSTHAAYFTVKKGLLPACNALVREQDLRLCLPASEAEMPVLFNEYCTTWGCPSRENIRNILAALKGFPVSCFVIDCGWYKPDDRGWGNAIGDWKVSGTLFPNGIREVADEIRAAGMIPGIWFEWEVAGRDSDCFSREELFLHRDGVVITSKNRRFFDLRRKETKEYLRVRFLEFLAENGFGYLKIDYNDTYGVGCDTADGEALGEGGRQVAEESLRVLDELRARFPELVIENCSSGGSRIEPLRMSKVSMCSFSDAHECTEIPLVAANVSRVIPARQMQVWAVLREREPLSRTVYSLCAAMLGRICLSGDVLGMSPEKRDLIAEGLDFYGNVKQIVAEGEIVSIDCDVGYYREPIGRQIYVKEFGARRLVIVHRLKGRGDIRISARGYRLVRAFTDLVYTKAEDELVISDGGEFHAGAFLFEKEEGTGERP